MSGVTEETIAEAMFAMVSENAGKKKFKPMDLTKAMLQQFEGQADKKMCKDALKNLIESGRVVYTYFGASYIEIPHEEGAAK